MLSPEVTTGLSPLSAEEKNTISTIMQSQQYMDAEDVMSKKLYMSMSLSYLLTCLHAQKAEIERTFISGLDSGKVVGDLAEGKVNELYVVFRNAQDQSNLEVDWVSFFYRPEFIAKKPLGDVPTIPYDLAGVRKEFNNTRYIGNAHEAFYSCLTTMDVQFMHGGNIANPTKPYYGKFCSVAQSSGTGKTRLLAELPDTRVLYINLRSPSDRFNYPPRDDIPAKMLNAQACPETHFERRCCAFFAAIFDRVDYEFTNGVGKNLPAWRSAFFPDLPHRHDFFNRLQTRFDVWHKGSESEMITAPLSGSSGRDNGRPLSGEVGMLTTYQSLINGHKDIFERGDNKPQLVIVLDEAAILCKAIVSDSPSYQYLPSDVLCRVINRYSNSTLSPIWVVFASTESKIVEFATPNIKSNSMRLNTGGELLFPPFVEVGFDQFAPALDQVDMGNIASVKHLARFGRPLWNSLRYKSAQELQQVAKVKLLGGDVGFSPKNDHHSLVILSQRFALDIVFSNPKSTEFIDTSVASHLRICTSISDDRLWKSTTYPSEPLLSHCAAALMWKSAFDMAEMFRQLGTQIRDGMIDKGKSGELGSRVCTLLAKDLRLRQRSIQLPVDDVSARDGVSPKESYSESVPVIDWLVTLFGERVITDDCEVAFAGWEINFSHWVCMGEKIGDQPKGFSLNDWMKRHYVRSSAVQCAHNQDAVDKMIPMRRDDDYSQIYIQDKNTIKPHPSLHTSIDRNSEHIQTENDKPWVVIVMDIGVDHTPLKVVVDPARPQTRSKPRRPLCWRIYAAGKTQQTYPFLGETDFPLGTVFGDLLTQEFQPSPRQVKLQPLRDKVQFGFSTHDCHMEWEKQDQFGGRITNASFQRCFEPVVQSNKN